VNAVVQAQFGLCADRAALRSWGRAPEPRRPDDDLSSTDPWRPRGIEVRGRAEAIETPRPLIRIHPQRIVSWGIDSRGRFSRAVRPDEGATEEAR
jgi:pyridoxamine 5'-phosphate oxidase family protein